MSNDKKAQQQQQLQQQFKPSHIQNLKNAIFYKDARIRTGQRNAIVQKKKKPPDCNIVKRSCLDSARNDLYLLYNLKKFSDKRNEIAQKKTILAVVMVVKGNRINP